jgi:cyclophilin family peptidyl-prolyl cis-trans isomerase
VKQLPTLVALIAIMGSLLALPAQQQAAESPPTDSDASRPIVEIKAIKGAITIELYSDLTPATVDNFLKYVDAKFYDDTIFHRVIAGFVIQGGGFTPELEMLPTLPPIKIESNKDLANVRGTVAMARMDDKDSASSQFFINVDDNSQLDRTARSFGYTVFGEVVEGMDVALRISNVQTSSRGRMKDVPILPVIIESVRRVEK